MDGFGMITWWGFSPALDLQTKGLTDGLKNLTLEERDEEPLNILLVGAGDSRHILKTLSRLKRRKRPVNFYVLENCLEVYARDLLFVALALEPQRRLGLQDKTELFLELYGNSLVREQTMEYVEKMANMFMKFVTDFDYLEKKFPILDLSSLKFKERDILENIFKFWRNSDRKVFDIAKCWDLRLRQYLGVRYDAVPNVFDWDLNMKLADRGAQIIHTRHYSRWRHKGVAFEIREGNYTVPNKTLASGRVFKQDGERLARRGYWGDILVSPYIAFGIESEEQSFFSKSNNVYTKSSPDVAEFNVMAMFSELATGREYKLQQATQPDVQQGATLTEITEEDEESTTETSGNRITQHPTEPENPLGTEYEPIEIESAKIHFLPLSCLADLSKKSRYQKLFNFIYLGNTMVHNLQEELTQTFADTATLLLETSNFMIELNKEQQEAFLNKAVSLAQGVGCKVLGKPETTDNHIQFEFRRVST